MVTISFRLWRKMAKIKLLTFFFFANAGRKICLDSKFWEGTKAFLRKRMKL